MAVYTVNGESDYDRDQEIKQFDNSKLGVKGLVDSGLTSIPRIFIHPPETLHGLRHDSRPETPIPTIDLACHRSSVVEQISNACRKFGFFQITNHGIAPEILDRSIAGIKAFHEQPAEVRAQVYCREGSSVLYYSNVDLYSSKAASWRDNLVVETCPQSEATPEICRDEVAGWDREIRQVGELLMELMSEGLGLNAGRLKEMTCLEGRKVVGNYYPPCPQPDLTVGHTSHADPDVLTVLLQDQKGGLQAKYGEDWVDVKPIPGALVVNVGDVLQLMSNGEYKSVDHRVLVNPHSEPRVSIALFFKPSNRDGMYGPLPELVSSEKPALYRQFTITEFMQRFFEKGLDGKALVDYFKL